MHLHSSVDFSFVAVKMFVVVHVVSVCDSPTFTTTIIINSN